MMPSLTFITILLLGTEAALAFSRFPSEPLPESEEDYDPEEALESRARHLRSTCWKYSDFSRPEFVRIDLSEATADAGNPAVVFDLVEPAFQVCVPRQSAVGAELWKDWRAQAEAVLGGEASGSNKGVAKRMKLVSVEHPLHRLARAYLSAFKDGDAKEHEEEFNQLRKLYRKAKGEMLTFKDLVRFLTRGGEDFGPNAPIITSWSLYGEVAPYYENCPVCHKDLLPSFVLKSDYPSFEADVEFLQEVFGLEDVDFPFNGRAEPVSPTALKALYGQLSRDELEELVQLYKIDLEMFQYDPEMFFEMLKE